MNSDLTGTLRSYAKIPPRDLNEADFFEWVRHAYLQRIGGFFEFAQEIHRLMDRYETGHLEGAFKRQTAGVLTEFIKSGTIEEPTELVELLHGISVYFDGDIFSSILIDLEQAIRNASPEAEDLGLRLRDAIVVNQKEGSDHWKEIWLKLTRGESDHLFAINPEVGLEGLRNLCKIDGVMASPDLAALAKGIGYYGKYLEEENRPENKAPKLVIREFMKSVNEHFPGWAGSVKVWAKWDKAGKAANWDKWIFEALPVAYESEDSPNSMAIHESVLEIIRSDHEIQISTLGAVHSSINADEVPFDVLPIYEDTILKSRVLTANHRGTAIQAGNRFVKRHSDSKWVTVVEKCLKSLCNNLGYT